MLLQSNTETKFAMERGRRLQDEIAGGNRVFDNFVALLKKSFYGLELSSALTALDFAKSIDYHHQGLSSQGYLNHPLRVATYVLEEAGAGNLDILITAMLHNVLEVSHVTAGELTDHFGSNVSDSIIRLTVDRSRQNDLSYKRAYYARICDGTIGARIVKVLDKFDNIFLICFNPSESVRNQYLKEIEMFVLPIAQRDLPSIASHLETLTTTMKTFGYLDKETAIAKMSHMEL